MEDLGNAEKQAEPETQRVFGEEELALLRKCYPELAPDTAKPGLGLPEGERVERLLNECGGHISLLEAYRLVHFDELLGRAEQRAHEDALRQLKLNAEGSPGSAGGGGGLPGFWEMPESDFAALVERAKRGELKAT